jgi:Alpha galactosidase A
MKRRSFLSSSILGVTGVSLASCTGINKINPVDSKLDFKISELAPKPPLGYNSFDSYGVYLHHDAAMAGIKAMAEKLKPHGYEYFVIDAGWFGEFKLIEGTMYSSEKHAAELKMNEYGILQPSNTYFGQGFAPIVEYAHELGLKMGIHLMRGIPRKAVELNLPIKNSQYRAGDIADVNSICVWCAQNYGIDMSKPGAQDYYNSVYTQVAEWGFDFVKVDDLNAYPKEIVAIAKAIENTGRKMVLSLSPGVNIMQDLTYYKKGNMLRITKDIWDNKLGINRAFESWKKFQGIAHEGFWPDLDMIPFGNLQLMSPAEYSDGDDSVAFAGLGNTRHSEFTPEQMRTFITIRSLAASPLMMGGDLPTMDDYSLELITNKEMLACNQNGECGINTYEKNGIEVWMTPEKELPGKGWMGIFNRNDVAKSITLTRKEMGFVVRYHGQEIISNDKTFEFTDVWNNKTWDFTSETIDIKLEADDVVFIRFIESNK